MVYKRGGILNTAEAWRSLVQIRKVIPEVAWDNKWVETDCQKLIREVKKHGYLRSPYFPENRPHESIDAGAFALLMFQSFADNDVKKIPKLTDGLALDAVNWLIKNQAKSHIPSN